MNILHVEDDIDWFERTIRPSLIKIGVNKICHADTYKKGVEFLQTEQIDYVVLDLAIPLDEENQSPEVSNGLKLATYIRVNFPGTPVLILTGQQTEEAVEQFVDDQEVTIFWDGKAKSLVKVKPKRWLLKVIELLSEAVTELEAIDAIDIETIGCDLDNLDKRVLKLFCKHNGAIAARVKPLNEGLSSAKVLQVNLINNKGQDVVWTALVKVDTKENIDIEHYNFNSFVNKLPVGSYPNILNQYSAGCANKKGVFYRFATQYNSNYFEQLIENEKNALSILSKIRPILDTWNNNKQVKQVLVSEVRRTLCTDIKFTKVKPLIIDLGLDEFERKTINANYCIQHSDLHGQNILVSKELIPILIDYGDVQETSSVLDIVTLELSPYFHPSMKSLKSPDIELFKHWFDDDEHFKLSPYPNVTKFLRDWRKDNSFMNREYIVTVYAYAIRQLTYGNTNKSFAITLIKSAISAYK